MLAAGARARPAPMRTGTEQLPPRARRRRGGGGAAATKKKSARSATTSDGGQRSPAPPPLPSARARISVRRARLGDVPAIAALERACAPLSAGWTERQVEEELPREIAVVLVAEEEEEGRLQEGARGAGGNDTAAQPLAGWAAAWHVAGELQVLAIAVEPSVRRAGVGRALLSELLAVAGDGEEEEEDNAGKNDDARDGTSRPPPPPPLATLELRADNAAAAALYASCGFVEVGRRKGYYDGGAVDALLLEKPRIAKRRLE